MLEIQVSQYKLPDGKLGHSLKELFDLTIKVTYPEIEYYQIYDLIHNIDPKFNRRIVFVAGSYDFVITKDIDRCLGIFTQIIKRKIRSDRRKLLSKETQEACSKLISSHLKELERDKLLNLKWEQEQEADFKRFERKLLKSVKSASANN